MQRRHFVRTALACGLLAAPLSGAFATPLAMTVYKTPWCGCCGAWVDHLRTAGFTVDVRDLDDLAPVKRMAGVPEALASCHTGAVDGYTIEGHVPAHLVRRLLDERPAVRGLAVPGMPIGSPGMEGPSPEPYTVYSFAAGSAQRPFAVIRP
jgi:hypothetical protein